MLGSGSIFLSDRPTPKKLEIGNQFVPERRPFVAHSDRTWTVMLRRTRPSRSILRSVAASDFWLTQSTLSNSREKRNGPSYVSSPNVQRLHTGGEKDQLSMGVRLSAVDIFGSGE